MLNKKNEFQKIITAIIIKQTIALSKQNTIERDSHYVWERERERKKEREREKER